MRPVLTEAGRRLVVLVTAWTFLSGTDCASVRPYKVTNFFRSAKLATAGVTRVAVLPFENLTKEGSAPGIAAEEFSLQLGKTGLFDLVERSRIEELWREQDLDTLSRFDAGTAVKIGKMLGAEAVILGSVTRFVPHPEVKVDTVRRYDDHYHHHREAGYPAIIVVGNEREHDACAAALTVLAAITVVGAVLLLLRPKPPAAQVGISARLVDVETGDVLWQAKDNLQGNQKSVQALVETREDRLRMVYDIEYLTQILCRELVGTLLQQRSDQ
jgi:TolB-like protein